eukprot:Pgem_evm2s19755
MTGLVDSGATKTILNKNKVDDINANIKNKELELCGISKNIKIQSFGVTTVNLQLGKFSATCDVELCDIDDYDIILGMDVLPLLGIYLSGIPPPYWYSNLQDTAPVLEKIKTITSEEVLGLREKLASVLAANSCIDVTDWATIANSTIEIKIDDSELEKVRFHRQNFVPLQYYEDMDKQLAKWLAEKVVVPNNTFTPVNIPLLAVPQYNNDGTLKKVRICLDLRMINRLVKTDKMFLPRIEQVTKELSGYKYFSCLDLTSGYHQFKVHPDSQKYLSFTWRNKQYRFQGSPFGLSFLVTQFHRCIVELFRDLAGVYIYLDDIVIATENEGEHYRLLKIVLERLTENKLTLNSSKCVLGAKQVKVLGFIVSETGVRVDPQRIAHILEIEKPKTGKDLSSILGMTNFFRSYIPNYSIITRPLDSLRKVKSLEPYWQDSAVVAAYDTLLLAIQSPAVLQQPLPSVPFHLEVDASHVGIGGCLYQLNIDGSKRVIRLFSYGLKGAQMNWSAEKRELFAVKFGIEHLQEYLIGCFFHVHVDNQAITSMHSYALDREVIRRWFDVLGSFSFDVTHRPRNLNVLADSLSKLNYSSRLNDNLYKDPGLPVLGKNFVRVVRAVSANSVALSQAEKIAKIQLVHNFTHQNVRKTVALLRGQGYDWPDLLKLCTLVYSKCRSCEMNKIQRYGFHPLVPITAEQPFYHVIIDLVKLPSHRGYSYVLHLHDVFTSLAVLRPLRSKSADVIARKLFKIFSDFGYPKILSSDNGSEFKNALMASFSSLVNITRRFGAPYSPMTQGSNERKHIPLKNLLKAELKGFPDWPTVLPIVATRLNQQLSDRQRSIAFDLFFARKNNLLLLNDAATTDQTWQSRIDELYNLVYPAVQACTSNYYASMVKSYDKRKYKRQYQIGDVVKYKIPGSVNGLMDRYIGPYRIAGKKHTSYLLCELNGSPAVGFDTKLVPPHQLFPVINFDCSEVMDSSASFKKILDYGVDDNQNDIYNVLWSDGSTSWITAAQFDDPNAVQSFWKKRLARS